MRRESAVTADRSLRFALLAALALPAVAHAEAPSQLSEVVVVAPTPLEGRGVDPDKLPAVVETMGSDAFVRSGSLAVTDALEQHVAGLSLSDTQGNAFTRDVNFRGFEASPLQGTPQGLAVYMDGVRLNEAFGDTVNWDLVPEVAIARANLFTSNPAFGLNALGGAVTLRMKTGFDAAGGEAVVEGGSFGRIDGSAAYGATSGPWGLYLAADGGHDDGWRLQSPSDIARFYGDLGWKDAASELHLVVAGAANNVGVVGPTPVDLLAQDRRAVFTFPQTTRDNTALLALNGRHELSAAWSLQGDAYLRKFNQHHVDGNDGNFAGCGDDPADPLAGTLCVDGSDFPDAVRPPAAAFQVLGPGGAPIGCPPLVAGQSKLCNGIPYGTVDRTRTDSLGWGGSLQASSDAKLWGHGNVFAAGASADLARVRFSANSELGVINPDLSVGPDADLPGSGQIIHTAGNIAYSPVELRATTAYLGLYATDTFDLTGRLSLTLSGRFNHARLEMTDLTGNSPDLNGTHSFDRFNPAAGLAWRVTGGLTLYGGYAEANRAPTPLELACSNPLAPCLIENALVSDPPLKQVVAHTWEAGLRGQAKLADGGLKWRLGAFRTDNDDDIVALASAIQGRGSFANVPKTRRQGFEASADLTAGRWLAYAGYSYIQATYQFTGDLPSPNSPFADDDGNLQVTPGDRIGGIPSQRFKLGADLAVTPAITVGADAIAVGSQYLVGDEANQDAKLPSYWVANLHGSWRLNPRLEVFARVDNLFDRHYATFGTYFETDSLDDLDPSPLPDNPSPVSLTPAPPRSFLLGVRARW
ncbi:MAG: TonB-dependent receptor [Phenylobacterium sp.]|nr:MAG: TonB-dependent receptor [Phenylobacterium sp.]